MKLRGLPLPRSARGRFAVAIALVAASIGGCMTLELKERELVFRPIRETAGWYSGMPDGMQELWLSAGAGAGAEEQRIHAWWWPDGNPDAPVVYYLHGARWNLTGHVNRIAQLRRFGYSVFAIDYRGFGRSDGDVPSEASVYEDARAGWRWVIAREPDAARRFIYGHSLGGAVAIDLAVQVSAQSEGAAGVIVESSFTSLADMAAELANGWPVGLLLSQKFDSIDKIGRIRMPVLIVHGGGDRYVPARFSEALYAAAPEPKKLLVVPNGSHNNSMLIGDAQYREALHDVFGRTGERRMQGADASLPAPPQASGRAVNRAPVPGVSGERGAPAQ